jgi:hypothetical protein
MLTIQNPRKGAEADNRIQIGSFKLVDAGLYKRPDKIKDISGNYDYYCFYWSYNDEGSRFKCFLERKPIEGTTSIYNFRIYDEKKGFTHYRKVVNNNKAGLIYDASVGTYTHLRDRISFYTWMTNKIIMFM